MGKVREAELEQSREMVGECAWGPAAAHTGEAGGDVTNGCLE